MAFLMKQALRDTRPLVMGIVNVTPDSFSDGGRFLNFNAALSRALKLLEEGADWIDVGGESSRPGAVAVSTEEELNRVIPLVAALAKRGVAVSVDTTKAAVMREAIHAGAAMINDITALEGACALEAVADTKAAVCLTHMKGQPSAMQEAPHYENVVAEVFDYLRVRASACEAAGIARERIVLDPGFGFGKTVEHNLTLARALPKLCAGDYPVLVGWSRKSTLGAIVGKDVSERLPASLAAALASIAAGASIVRVHDVRETVDAIKVWQAMSGFLY